MNRAVKLSGPYGTHLLAHSYPAGGYTDTWEHRRQATPTLTSKGPWRGCPAELSALGRTTMATLPQAPVLCSHSSRACVRTSLWLFYRSDTDRDTQRGARMRAAADMHKSSNVGWKTTHYLRGMQPTPVSLAPTHPPGLVNMKTDDDVETA